MVAEFLETEGLPSIDESIRGIVSEAVTTIEIAARLCYMSFGKGRKDIGDFITNLLVSKDGSVLEHVNYGFVITGVSRSLSHEMVRHRAGFAYSQRSQRYVDEGDAAYVVPPTLLADSTAGMDGLQEAVQMAQDYYSDLVAWLEELPTPGTSARDKRKLVRQAARSVLPNATETKLFVTGNVRAWRHFIEVRATEFADLEIRRLAMEILVQLGAEEPLLFGDFVIDSLSDGTLVAAPKYSKV